MNDLRHMFPHRGNAEGYCRKCGLALGISGQCVGCATEKIPMFAKGGPTYTAPAGWGIEPIKPNPKLKLNRDYFIVGDTLYHLVRSHPPLPDEAAIVLTEVGEFVPLPAHEHAYWEAFTGWVD